MTPEFWAGRSVFVTGATGIVGSWLARKLVECGAEVVALVRDADPASELVRSGAMEQMRVASGELEDYRTLERAINEHEIDTVFHLGAQTTVEAAHRQPFQTFESNIRGTYNLLEACRTFPQLVRRVVIASSDKAYGASDELPYVETMPLNGRFPYEVSKSCADMLSQSYYDSYRLPVTIARCGNIYGGGDFNWSRIVPGTIRSIWRGERPVIRSNGAFLRDYVYVKDVVNAYLTLGEWSDAAAVEGQAFNFAPELPLSVLDMVREIAVAMGRSDIEPDIRNYATGEILNQYLSADKARRMLGWQPGYTLAEGLAETLAWYRDYFESRNRIS